MKKKGQIKIKDPIDTILNGMTDLPLHENYKKALAIITPKKEKFKVKNPISGKEANITLHRDGTTDEKLAMIMLSPDATKDQKDSILASYLFERGRENASFITELYISKGRLFTETQAFKKQMRWDFESFANMISLLFSDMADDMETNSIKRGGMIDYNLAFRQLAERLKKGSEIINKQREGITEARMREKGFGVYLDKNGKAFSIFDDEIEGVVHQEREEAKKKKKK